MKLAVFDLDGTLLTTMDKPQTNEGARLAGWNGKDWWGSKCSLRDVSFHENIKNVFERDRNDPNTYVALLTGRRGPIAWRVREILREAGLPGRRIIPPSNPQARKHFHDFQENEDAARHCEFFCGDFVFELNYPKNSKGKPVDNTWTHKRFIIETLLINKTEVEFWDDRKEHFRAWMDFARDIVGKKDIAQVTLHQIFPEPNVINPYVVDHCFVKNNGNIKYFAKDGNGNL